MIKITIEQLKYFLAVEKYKNFSVASHELCISQSSLSKHIKALENELDTILFNRTTRNITLTDSGKELLEYAPDFIKNYDNILLNMKKHSKNKISKIRIGTIPVISQYNITQKIMGFQKIKKDIQIDLIEDSNTNIMNMLKEKKIDFAFLRNLGSFTNEFDTINLLDDELVVITSKNHHFTKKKYLTFKDLESEEFILLGKNSGLCEKFYKECEKYNFSPKVKYEMYKIETILGLVSENIGITILMKKVLNSFNTSDISINLLKQPIILPLALVSNKSSILSKDCTDFKSFIRKI